MQALILIRGVTWSHASLRLHIQYDLAPPPFDGLATNTVQVFVYQTVHDLPARHYVVRT